MSSSVGDTYSDKDAVWVHRFSPTLFSTSSAEYFCQAPGVVDSQDVDVILAAESLNEGEVDLQSHVLDIFAIAGQDAQDHVIRVSGSTNDEILLYIHIKTTLHVCEVVMQKHVQSKTLIVMFNYRNFLHVE